MSEEKRKKMSWRKNAKKVRIVNNNISISIPKEIKTQIKGFENIWYKFETDGKNINLVSGCRFSKIYLNSKSNIHIELKKKKEELKEKGIDFFEEDKLDKLWTREELKLIGFDEIESDLLSDI